MNCEFRADRLSCRTSPNRPAKQLLHLVFGGELNSVASTEFRNLDKLDIVGVYPNYASAYAAWKAKAQGTVDNAEMRYFIVHLHRLLDPENRSVVALGGRMSGQFLGRSRCDRLNRPKHSACRSPACRGLSVRDRLPLALRFYRLASIAAAPAVASRLLAWRLKRGKENPARYPSAMASPSCRARPAR